MPKQERAESCFSGICPEFILIRLNKSWVFTWKILKAKETPVEVFDYSVQQIYGGPMRCASYSFANLCVCLHAHIHIQSLILIILDRQDEFPSTS